mmetsp:Transcript_12291/g.17476  ORF Transcript_12291/g.17476 Transcript_12291/m.17476 type:complete len:451 (+) Transcript_12291:46-1398(+)
MRRARRDASSPSSGGPRVAVSSKRQSKISITTTAPQARMDAGSFMKSLGINVVGKNDDEDEQRKDGAIMATKMSDLDVHQLKTKISLGCFGLFMFLWMFSGGSESSTMSPQEKHRLAENEIAGEYKSLLLNNSASSVEEDLHPGKFGGLRNRFRKRDGKRIPEALRYLADMKTPYNKVAEVPYFWDIPFSGETMAERMFRKCHILVQACEKGVEQPDFNDEKLEVFTASDGSQYVNVDTTTISGIERAQDLNLAHERIADIMVSPLVNDFAKHIFDEDHMGRMFALFRHPVDRAISMYYYLGSASWDPLFNPKIKQMTLVEYARSASMENNWVTRFLLNKFSGPLQKDDMRAAKEVVRKKVLVGLFDDIEGSMARFEKYFGWTQPGTEDEANTGKCRKAIIEAWDKRHDHPPIIQDGPEWKAIVAANRWDLELYQYVKILYKYQGKTFLT